MSKFSIPLDRLAERYNAKLEQVVRQSTFQLFNAVQLRSPVDTGRFRGNWNVSYNAPDFVTTPSTNANRAAIEVQKALTLPVGGITYMSNGLPYARRLEYGYSKQAPQGMVRISVREFRDYVRKAIA